MGPVSKTVLAERLRQCREALGLTQAQVADHLGIPRTSLVDLEAGQRQVSSPELSRLAILYGREALDFFDQEFDPVGVLTALFRDQLGTELAPSLLETIGRFLEASRRLSNLESVLMIERAPWESIQTQALSQPRGLMEAVRQGESMADQARRRLGLGVQPLPDLSELLESAGVRTLVAQLPEGVEGVTLCSPDSRPFIVLAAALGGVRQRFSLAHEYGHVLMDPSRGGMITRRDNQKELREIRANAFAGAFLMPAAGVEEFMAGLGKPRRRNTPVVMEETGFRTVRNTEPGWVSEVQVFDVLQLAAYFQVSRESALFRLASLELIKPGDRENLQRQLSVHGAELGQWMGIPDERRWPEEASATRCRLIGLLLEALRREEVSRRWALEVARLVGISEEDFERALDAAGIVNPPADVLLPEGL